jgi:hypothetical protein
MKTKRDRILILTLNVMLPAVWSAGIDTALAGVPRAAGATVTRTGPAGRTSTRQTNVATNGQGGFTSHSTLTGPAGNTVTRQQSGSYNPATRTYTRSGTTTGPNGAQSSFNTSVQATGNGYNRTATRTGPAGNAVIETRTVTAQPSGG